MNLMRFKLVYFAISLIFLVPGLLSLLLFGLKPAIDFTGGSLLEIKMINDEQIHTKILEASDEASLQTATLAAREDEQVDFATAATDLQPLAKNNLDWTREEIQAAGKRTAKTCPRPERKISVRHFHERITLFQKNRLASSDKRDHTSP